MDLAIVFYFDKKSEDILNNTIKYLACDKTNNYMIDHKITPHVTLSMFNASEIAAIEKIIDINVQKIPKCDFTWASIGTFIPNVLFAAPVINKQIIAVNEMVNKLLKPAVDRFVLYYQPDNWVPHTTLATQLTRNELSYAFDIAVKKFVPLSGYADRIALVECNPYKEIRIWQL